MSEGPARGENAYPYWG